jgi:hypothetical protein
VDVGKMAADAADADVLVQSGGLQGGDHLLDCDLHVTLENTSILKFLKRQIGFFSGVSITPGWDAFNACMLCLICKVSSSCQ